MKHGTENLLKFKQLQRRLGLTLWQVNGLLETLWRFVRINAPRGDIGRFTNEEIAIGIDWQDDDGLLVSTLTETKWLDVDDSHRLIVHDWWDHCEDSVHTALAKKTEVFADGRFPKLTRITTKERNAIERKYKQKYSKEELENGRAFQSVLERSETLQNAYQAMPSHALPDQTIPGPRPVEGSSSSPKDFSDQNRKSPSKFDVSEVDFDQAIFDARKLAAKIKPRAEHDTRRWIRLAVASQMVLGDGFIPDALEAVNANASRDGPHAHFIGVCNSKAAENHNIADLNEFLKRIPITSEQLEAVGSK